MLQYVKVCRTVDCLYGLCVQVRSYISIDEMALGLTFVHRCIYYSGIGCHYSESIPYDEIRKAFTSQ